MFGFRRKKKNARTASTFVEATGGGWSDIPESVSARGGSQEAFVRLTLERARNYAIANNIPEGSEFEFPVGVNQFELTITDIPVGIKSPHEISFGIIMLAFEYGLSASSVINEKVRFIRLS